MNRFHASLFFLALGMSPTGWTQELNLKNFRELFASYASATNVNPKTAVIRTYFLERGNSLPQTGKLSEINARSVVTSLGLAGYFCEKMLDTDEKEPDHQKRWAHAGIDFSQAPVEVFTSSVRAQIMNVYAGLFWQRPTLPEETAIFDQLMLDFSKEFQQEKNGTKSVLLATCSTFGASFESLIGIQ